MTTPVTEADVARLLKPCPFCGSAAEARQAHDEFSRPYAIIVCRGCGATASTTLWNTRALDQLEAKAASVGWEGEAFQRKVQPWLMECFGEMIAGDREERNHRFLEEALELVQACGCTVSEAHQLVDYVYGRPVGELHQEVGGVMVTLAALCLANDADMHAAGWVELDRIWGKVEAIRVKQAGKPKHSPLPALTPTPPEDTDKSGDVT